MHSGAAFFRLRARYFAHGGKVPKAPPGVPGPQERGVLLNWPGGGGGGFHGGLQNLPAGRPTHQAWQNDMAKRGILTRPLRGLQRQDGRRAPGYCALRRRTGCGGFPPAGGTGVRLPCMAALHGFRQARNRSRRAAIYGGCGFPEFLRKDQRISGRHRRAQSVTTSRAQILQARTAGYKYLP